MRWTAQARVSVVIPCYNQAHFLSESIHSVLAQTHLAWQIIVVDDGSTDNTATVAERFPEVRCIRQRNQGLSAARNAGLRASTGDFLVFLDADDRLLPHALATGLQHFAGHPECVFVAGLHRSIAADGSPMVDTYRPRAARDQYRQLLERNHIPNPGAVMYRRAPLEAAGGFDSAVNAAADYALYLRLARQHSVHCYPEVVVEYRQHETSMSRRSALMLRTVLAILDAERANLRSDVRLRRAYRKGVRFYREYYGAHLANDIRVQIRSHAWSVDLIRDLGLLLWQNPGEVTAHLSRRIRNRFVKRAGGDSPG